MQTFNAGRIIFFVCALALLCSCKHKTHTVTRSFYYWKTIYKPTAYEVSTLHSLSVNRIYFRLFDIDWEPRTLQPIPIAPIELPGAMDSSFDYVPVVFITQKLLAGIQGKDLPVLAKKMDAFISGMTSIPGMHPNEIQIDCDWTAGTKDIYFGLLSELKQQPYFKGKKLSCTIRMHQLKYFSGSGIPPADKGLLMCYSMGNLKKYGVLNSILDVKEAEKYLANMDKYPLPLDIALPVFQWCVLFREKQYYGIMHSISPGMVTACDLFEQKQDNLYRCRRDAMWNGFSLRTGDVLRLEGARTEDLEAISRYTSKRLRNTDVNVVFFSCDSITLSKYSTHELEAVYNAYR